jgi:Tfp pilus assembly protein PilF
LSGEEQGRLTKRYAGNAEAYELYLKGRYFTHKFTPEGYEKSLEFYRRAIEKDPGYAMAYSGIAWTYASMTFEGLLPPGEGWGQVERAVTKALELDETEAPAHMSLGNVKWARDWDWRGAEDEFRRALALEPENYEVSRRFSQYLRAMGRWEEAFAQIKRASEGDPLSVETNEGLAGTYYWAGRLEEATAQLQKTLEIEPNSVSTRHLLAEVYARRGLQREAIEEMRRAFVLSGDEESAEALAQDFRSLGFEQVIRGLNEATLDHLKESARESYVSPFSFAVTYAKLGERDQAFAWLEKAHAERSPWLVHLKVDPELESLRSDPRFADLAKRIGLP